MYGVDTMASMLKIELENAQNRHTTLIKTGRKDIIAQIVLDRIQQEITSLERSIRNEEESRQEVTSRASTCGITRRFRETMHRYWAKCYGNNNAISSIPTSAALQEARATT